MNAKSLFPFLFAAFLVSVPTQSSFAQTAFQKNATDAAAACQAFNGRSLTVVVPFRAGGGFDIEARAFRPFLQKHSQMDVSVANIAGASGTLAARAVADAPAGRAVVGLMDPRIIAIAPYSGTASPDLNAFLAVGSLGKQSAFWVTQKSFDWANVRQKSLVGSTAGDPARLALPAKAMNLDIKHVTGFNSTSETWTAFLRGDIDVFIAGKDTVERFVKSAPNATIALSLTSEPDPDFPTAPYLAGVGGMADRLSVGQSPENRKAQMTYAATAVTFSDTSRVFLVSNQAQAPLRLCLENAIAAALIDPERLASPMIRESNLTPQTLRQANESLTRLKSAIANNHKFLTEVLGAGAPQR